MRRLEAAGIRCLPIPTPFAVGRVNVWLVEDDPLTLVDCGPNSGLALDELETALRDAGRRIEDLERIVLTHQHFDHVGLVGILARRSGAEVVALDRLAPVVEDSSASAERDDELAEAIMLRNGIGRDVVTALRSLSRAYRGWSGSAPVARPVADGSVLEFAGRRLEVQHRPGHSPSDTLFWDAERALLIGGDHLLGHISSNPLIARSLGGRSGEPGPERPRALAMYMESLRATRQLPVEVVLPGHGEPITEHARLIDERFESHERRAAKIAGLLAERPRTAHEIAHALWGTVAVTQAYLTLCEVLGHVDLLVSRGQVRETEAGGVATFEPV
jgi:glyoxylase-like metal-dependent hydrolase (beta-lactamase superfamily II)